MKRHLSITELYLINMCARTNEFSKLHIGCIELFRKEDSFMGYGGYGYGFGLRRLLIFLLVIATIFALIGIGY
jgi:hypothetical protein